MCFLSARPNMKSMGHLYSHVWRAGLTTIYHLRSIGALSIEKASVGTKKKVRVVVVGAAAAAAPAAAPTRTYNEAEKTACSIEAMKKGEICGACQ